MTQGLTLIAIAAAALAVTTGCSSEQAPAPSALFDPCTTVTDDALTRAGADPATRKPIGGADGWRACEWHLGTAHLRVYSTSRRPAEFDAAGAVLTELTVADRTGRRLADPGALTSACDVLFDADQGVIRMIVVNRADVPEAGDACVTLSRAGAEIVPLFPD